MSRVVLGTFVALLLFVGGVGLYNYIDSQNRARDSLEAQIQALRNQNARLTAENHQIRGQLNELITEVAAQNPDSQVQAICDNADYLADLEVEVTVTQYSNFWRLLENLRRQGQHNFYYQMYRDPYHTSAVILCGYYDPLGPPNVVTFSLSGSLFRDDNDGKYYLLTAGHIRSDEYVINRITANFQNGAKADFELLGYDSQLDAALLKPQDPNFQFNGRLAVLGSSANLRAQQTLVAMGSPLAMPYTCTRGQVVNLRVGNAFPGQFNIFWSQRQLIMHDAGIDAGSSGGPLLNLSGEIVGINVMVMSRYYPWSLAVPMDDITAILPDLKNGLQR